MRVLKRNPWLAGLGALLAMIVLSAQVATADTSTDRGGSIIVFPKVIADGTRDTLIQISNLNNGLVFAHCLYLDASPENPFLPVNPVTNPRRCQERDFFIRLTRQQPTIWRASTGRLVSALDTVGTCEDVDLAGATRQNCPGFDPGNVPNLFAGPTAPFEGHLLCIQVDGSGAPVGGNALKGEAFLESVGVDPVAPGGDGVVSAYNAISIAGIEPDTDAVLNLDGVEYSACPDQLRFTHLAEGGADPVVPDYSATTELTLLPCTIDYETQTPPRVTLQFLVWDDMEIPTSFGSELNCWFDSFLSDINGGTPWDPSNSTTYMTQVRPSNGNVCRGGTTEYQDCTSDDDCLGGGVCAPNSGVLGVAETFRYIAPDGAFTGSSAINLHVLGTRENDQIFLESGVSGVCIGGLNAGNPCNGPMECPEGECSLDN